MTIDYAGETTRGLTAVEASDVDGAPREPDIVIDDLVVLRARINGFAEHPREVPAAAAAEHVQRLRDLILGAEPSMFAGVFSLEPFLVWAGSDGRELVEAAMGFAEHIVGNPTLGIDGPIRDFYWAQVGIASRRSGAWHQGPGRRVPPFGDFYIGSLTDVGRRASRLHNAGVRGSIAIDPQTRDILTTFRDNLEVEPLPMADDEMGWLVPATPVRGLLLARMPSD